MYYVIYLSTTVTVTNVDIAATSGRDSVLDFLLNVKGAEKIINQKNHMGILNTLPLSN
jgi:hypothetical protein